MHHKNRRRALRAGTHPRAFTMIELGVAVLVFTLIAGVVTIAVAGATVSGAKDRLENAVSGELRTLVATTVSGPYDDLVSGAFTRPEPCPNAAHRSCIEVMGREFTVDWAVSADPDDLAVSTEDPLGLQISASTTMPDGATVSVTRYRAPENLGAQGTGLLRIRTEGETRTGPVYLIRSNGSVAGAGTITDGRGAIRALATNCTRTTPCRLALTPNGSNIDGPIGIDAASLTEGAAEIILTEDATTEANVRLTPTRALVVGLLAENPDGRRSWATAPNTVCLTLEIPNADTVTNSTACNTETADRVIWRSVDGPHGATPVPVGVPITVRTDPAEGSCPDLGQLGWDATWTPAAVCTSWSWGTFDELRAGVTGTGTAIGEPILVGDATETHYTAVWAPQTSTSPSLPAGGWTGDALWENPRDIPGCATTASCTPSSSSPETGCPGEHCNHTGGTAPVLTAPRTGIHQTASVATPLGSSTAVTLEFVDNDGGDGITATILSAPAGLELDGAAVGAGDTIYTTATATGSVTLTHTPAGAGTGRLRLTISDGENERIETIHLATTPADSVVLLRAGSVRVTQNGTAATRILAIDASGEGAATLDAAFDLPTGVSAGNPVNGGDGWFTVTITAGAITAGTNPATVTADGWENPMPITVAATPGDIDATVTSVSLPQGDSETVTLQVLDVAGDDHTGAHAWLSLRDSNGAWPIGARTVPRGCITGADGRCTITITTEDAALAGTFTIAVHAAAIQAEIPLTVTSAIKTVTGTDLNIEQGSNANATVTVTDGRGEPAAATLLTLASATTGVTVPANVTTDADGEAVIAVTTTDAAEPGTATINVTAGGKTRPVNVKITGRVSSVTGPASAARLAQRGSTSVTVTARNPQGDPQAGRTLTITAPEGVYAPTSIYTLADGTSTFNLSAAADATLGNRTLTISSGGAVVGSVTINVVTGIAAVVVDGTLASGSARVITLTANGASGLGLAGRSITLRSADSRISVPAAPVNTNGLGRANFTITSGTIPAGIYRFTAVVDGREIRVEIGRP